MKRDHTFIIHWLKRDKQVTVGIVTEWWQQMSVYKPRAVLEEANFSIIAKKKKKILMKHRQQIVWPNMMLADCCFVLVSGWLNEEAPEVQQPCTVATDAVSHTLGREAKLASVTSTAGLQESVHIVASWASPDLSLKPFPSAPPWTTSGNAGSELSGEKTDFKPS